MEWERKDFWESILSLMRGRDLRSVDSATESSKNWLCSAISQKTNCVLIVVSFMNLRRKQVEVLCRKIREIRKKCCFYISRRYPEPLADGSIELILGSSWDDTAFVRIVIVPI